MGIFANVWFMWLFFLAMLALIALGVYLFSKSENIGAAGALLVAVICGFMWFFGATHRVVPANERWMYLDKASGAVSGPIRNPGLTTKPFWQYETIVFPGASEQTFCLDYYPALKEGYEILAHICGSYDASAIDWSEQFSLHNFRSETDMLRYWNDKAKDAVRSEVMVVDYNTINTNTVSVSSKVGAALTSWLDTQHVTAKEVILSNWNLTSKDVQAQVDAASAASMVKIIEKVKLDAAEAQRERMLYEVDTKNLVLAQSGTQFEALFASLGITSDSAKAQIIHTMTWFSFAENPPTGVTVIVGADSVAVPADNSNPQVPVTSGTATP